MSSPQLHAMAEFYRAISERLSQPGVDLATQRDIVERLHLLASEPEGVTYVEADADGVPVLWCIPQDAAEDRVLLHSHSGGAVLTTMHTDRKAVAHIAKATGARGLVVDYRLAPENKFPAQTDDVETVYRWLLTQGFKPAHIASIGQSIGGNYAVNLALTLRDKGAPLPGAILSISPWYDLEVSKKSVETNAALDMQLNKDVLLLFGDLMLEGTGVAKNDPRINLLYADPAGLPPTMIYYGTHEVLVDEAIAFAEKARAAGVDVSLLALEEGQHNFIFGAGRVPEVDAAIQEMARWLRPKLGLITA
uniref:Alpha/beta hydrolase fold-3 domain protein n=1 Tax=Caulobacter sp. (strain K31) TaxID=366602 RepID=B0T970_CAUSK